MSKVGKGPEIGGSGGVDAVDRAMAILSTFRSGRERQTLAELAAATGFYKSTILRLARSLEIAGFLHREEDGVFVIGSEPLRLAAVYRRSSSLEPKIRPVLRALVEETQESASFFRRQGSNRQCLYREDSPRAIRDHVLEGDVLPIKVGASGRVLTDFSDGRLSPAELARRSADLPYASYGERDAETAAVAAPVFGFQGLVGALTISGPRSRLTPDLVARIGPSILKKAENLSRLLGWEPPLVEATAPKATRS